MNFRAILDALLAGSVEFIVSGGVAAALHGAPLTTYELEVVHARDPENSERLMRVLAELDAWFRTHAATKLRPVQRDLLSTGHVLVMTKHGPLDLLGTVAGGLGYDDLVLRAHAMPLGKGASALVLDLGALIEINETTGREKDLAALPVLRRTLEETRRRNDACEMGGIG